MSFSAYFHVTFTLADRSTCSSQERWTKVHELQNQSFPGRAVTEKPVSKIQKQQQQQNPNPSITWGVSEGSGTTCAYVFLNGYCKPLFSAYGQCHKHGFLWQNYVVKILTSLSVLLSSYTVASSQQHAAHSVTISWSVSLCSCRSFLPSFVLVWLMFFVGFFSLSLSTTEFICVVVIIHLIWLLSIFLI